jgi:hypothetical protein
MWLKPISWRVIEMEIWYIFLRIVGQEIQQGATNDLNEVLALSQKGFKLIGFAKCEEFRVESYVNDLVDEIERGGC